MNDWDKFRKAIEAAAAVTHHGIATDEPYDENGMDALPSRIPKNLQAAQAEAQAAITAIAKEIGTKYGCSIIWERPRASRSRTAAEYKFWKTPVMMFIERPETLSFGPTKLARMLAPAERNFSVTKDIFYSPLSQPARLEAARLLASRGYQFDLPAKVSIRHIQKALKDHKDRTTGSIQYKPTVELIGDTIYCNGKSYKAQPSGAHGKRIRAGTKWLPLDGLIAFLSSES